MTNQVDHADLRPEHLTRLGDPKRRAQRLVEQLTHPGYRVDPTPAA